MSVIENNSQQLAEFIHLRVSKLERFQQERLKRSLGIAGDLRNLATFETLDAIALRAWADFYDFAVSPPRHWPEHGLRIFVSHVSGERERLGALRAHFAECSVNFFLAHDDISPGLSWSAVLQQALNEMDAFVSVHSSGYAISPWCNQEAGFALARNVMMISVLDGKPPCGFLNPPQGQRWHKEKDKQLLNDLMQQFSKDLRTSHKASESLSSSLKRVPSYNSADNILAKLDDCTEISESAALNIRSAYKFNDQVSGSTSLDRINQLLAKNNLQIISDDQV